MPDHRVVSELEQLELAALMADIDVIPIDLRYPKPSWMKDAACLEHPEVDFFPPRGRSTTPAKTVCASCLVRDECLTFALGTWGTVGVWGGTSERERRKISRGQPRVTERGRMPRGSKLPSPSR